MAENCAIVDVIIGDVGASTQVVQTNEAVVQIVIPMTQLMQLAQQVIQPEGEAHQM